MNMYFEIVKERVVAVWNWIKSNRMFDETLARI